MACDFHGFFSDVRVIEVAVKCFFQMFLSNSLHSILLFCRAEVNLLNGYRAKARVKKTLHITHGNIIIDILLICQVFSYFIMNIILQGGKMIFLSAMISVALVFSRTLISAVFH
jgi:hypothetical protein